MRGLRLAGVLISAVLCLQSCSDWDKGAFPEKTPPPQAVKLPGLTVDIKNKTVTGEGRICLASGILEYLIVATGGKDYESVIEMNVKPSDLHTALLIIGAVPGAMPEEFTAEKKGDLAGVKKKEEASRFVIFVEWAEGEKTVKMRSEKLLYDRNKNEAGRDCVWAFTGSYFYKDKEGKEHYLADEGKSIAAIWYDGGALLNLAEKSKNPYRGDDFGFEINAEKVPKKGSGVKVVFQRIH